MKPSQVSRAEEFLKRYRMLEKLLEKRYEGRKTSSPSVVMEYLRDADSMPWRVELDTCREIRNLLTHNADAAGKAVVEPSEAMLGTLEDIIGYVRRPRLAAECGTPGERVMFAHPNDNALDMMRHMMRVGYSHVPVRDKTGLLGVFSAAGVMRYLGRAGFERLHDSLCVGDMLKALEFNDANTEKYLFFDANATLTTVRAAFDRKQERNSRIAAAFITEDGDRHSKVLAMLTPWDLLEQREWIPSNQSEADHGTEQT